MRTEVACYGGETGVIISWLVGGFIGPHCRVVVVGLEVIFMVKEDQLFSLSFV